MKIRSIYSFAVLAALGASTLMIAGPNVEAKDRAAKIERRAARQNKRNRLEQMAQRLNLTADQQARIAPIMANSRASAKAVRDDALTKEQKREKIRAIRKDAKQQMKAILTDAQRDQLKAMRREKKGERADRKAKRDL